MAASGAFRAILLPVDLYNLVANSIKVDAVRKGKKDKESKAVKKLRELADELGENFARELETSSQWHFLLSKLKTEHLYLSYLSP